MKERAVAAATLLCFTATTISPSLAWAADEREVAPPTRVADEVEAGELVAGQAAVATPERPEKPAGVRPDDGALQGAVAEKVEKTPAANAEVQTTDAQTLALPTGADKSGVTSQAISVPKGAGTVQGMGESFSAQLSTGIATFSVPFALPAARGGAQPSLGLSYSSASGAGLAGMGWSVGVPFIARQTDRGLPKYDDRAAWHPQQDRFVFNGGQELVPICKVEAGLVCAGKLTDEVMPPWSEGHQYFRPRVEGSFLRFFWSADHLTWRVQDKSGITMELGVPLDGSGSRDALDVNPGDARQIYRWHLVRQYDTYGATPASANPASPSTQPAPSNVVVYKYEQRDGQAYLSDIYDTTPALTPTSTNLDGYAHHTRLEYEDRTDPTESYRSGWLMKQTRRLVRVDVASKTMLGGPEAARRMVRRYHLEYDSVFHTSYLTSVQVEGRCGDEGSAEAEVNGLLGDTSCDRLPPMTFEYSHVDGYNVAGAAITSELPGYEAFDARVLQVEGDPPHSVDEELTDYFDINSDGLPDVLVTAPGVYGNDYGVFFNSAGGVRQSFGAVAQLGVAGVLGANSGSIKLSNPNVAPLDHDGDGTIDFLHMPKVKTYSAYTPKWSGNKWVLDGRVITTASQQDPKIDWGRDTAETRVADVNFDGLVDVVVSTGTEFQTFFSLGRLPGGDGQFGDGDWTGKDTARIGNDPISKCVPYSGTPVRFSDGDIQLADLNGDGIQDIVRLRRGDFRYWPGRGNGYWGTGALDDCPAGTFGDKRYVTMADAPYYSDIQGTSLRIDDVNGDGLDDLVQVRFDAVDVWLNVDGKSWTKRAILDGTPASPSYANRVRLMDINGSGTRDIVWGNGKKYQFIDLAGGERPGLLVGVRNGLGKSTDIQYVSSAEEMLAADRTGQGCSVTDPWEGAWCSKMPTITHVVKRVTESDNLSVAGSGPGIYVTEYQYRDPVFDGRQREFRGFRTARSKRFGDANSPTDYTESTFLLGECEDEPGAPCSERWRDNPKEALKGLPVITERYDEAGLRLSTALTKYRLRHLYSGLDGRAVRHAFQSASKSYSYDTAAGVAAAQGGQTFDAVELELSSDPEDLDPASKVVPFVHYSGGGTAIVEGSSVVDFFGNQVTAVAHGCTGGSACPTADEVIYKYTLPTLISDSTGWLYRTSRSYVTGSAHPEPRGDSTISYNGFGAPISTSVVLAGTEQLHRFHETPGATFAAGPPVTASQNGVREVGSQDYDAFGNVTRQRGPTGSAASPRDLLYCRDVIYDSTTGYAQFPLAEKTYTGGCDSANPLQTFAGYDRGLGLVVFVQDMNGQESTVEYDGFGRLTQLTRPSAAAIEPLPSVQIRYFLPSVGDGRAYSVIHTKAQDGDDEAEDEYSESYSFVDGMGRARVGVTEADQAAGDPEKWIVSSIAEFDAKGAVRRKYLPFFYDADAHVLADPPAFPLELTPDAPYGRQRYDAFGRQVQTFDVDGTVTLQSRYHALSTDLYDAADLYPGPHQGSYASTRTDGHGRAVEATERVHVGGALEKRYVRTTYLPTGEPVTISRERDTSTPVMRWMRYDSLGRMVLNVDPHTSGSTFTSDLNVDSTPGPGSAGLKVWRYAYDDAGNLVGTSDARGCGQNFFYDGAGRLFAEDYSPCQSAHVNYTAPSTTGAAISNPAALANTNGIEILYQYDASLSNGSAPPPGSDGYSANFLKGRLAAVHDRASTTWFNYDERGRTTKTFRRVTAHNLGGNAVISTRYTPRWYKKEVRYDAADRSVYESTGARSPELLRDVGNGPESAVTTTYTRRGTIASVSSSYGTLVSSIQRGADGLVGEIVFGDTAGTTTVMKYDSRRRLASVQTSRSGTAWSSPPASYQPPPQFDSEDPPTSFQLLLQDLDYKYDVVGNPVEVRDWRIPEEWPEGAKPVSRRMEYDDLYRLTRIDYTYPGGHDKWVSPFAPELAGSTDPRRGQPMAHQNVPTRPLWQTYKYDWLGNVTQSDDDRRVTFDRSIGNFAHSATKPYQFTSAAPIAAGTYTSTTDLVNYDAAGNLMGFRVQRPEANCVGGKCNTRFFFTWDEVGRLIVARKQTSTGNAFARYTYDANDNRVRTGIDYSLSCAAGQCFDNLYIFDTLEVRRTAFASGEFPLSVENEVAYLNANGMRLGRLVYESAADGEPRSPSTDPVHVMLELPDHLGSASIVIDKATSELVEARTYQPFGATESDYRPERWKGFREDYGFTGKEEDVEVGLQYFGKRFLSPYLGRWISADPLAVDVPGRGDLNLYAYVRARTLRSVDPVGLEEAPARAANQPSWLRPGQWLDEHGGVHSPTVRVTIEPAEAPFESPANKQLRAFVGGVASATDNKANGVAAGAAGFAGGTAKAIGQGLLALALAPVALPSLAFYGTLHWLTSGGPQQLGSDLTTWPGAESGVRVGEALGPPLAGGLLAPKLPRLRAPNVGEGFGWRPATQQPRGGNGIVLRDGEGANAYEIELSQGPTVGSRAGQAAARQSLLDEVPEGEPYVCWRCGAASFDPGDMHLGHRNVAHSHGGTLHPANICLEGAACNLSSQNRGAPSPGMSCAERGSCGAPYGR